MSGNENKSLAQRIEARRRANALIEAQAQAISTEVKENPPELSASIDPSAASEISLAERKEPQERKPRSSATGGEADYQRVPTVSISIDAAKSIAVIFQRIAEKNGAASIRIDSSASKKDLSSIINLRAAEMKGLFE
jgi:hypothetical protein